MTATSHTLTARANFPTSKTATTNAKAASIQPLLIAKICKLRRIKPWTYLIEFLGLTEDVAHHRMSGRRAFTADELAGLLRTEDGFEFLVTVMADHRPAWWRICVPLMEVAEVKRAQIAVRRRLRKAVEGALDVDTEITAALARTEAFSDEGFYSHHASALRTVAGVQDSTMAKTAIPKTKP